MAASPAHIQLIRDRRPATRSVEAPPGPMALAPRRSSGADMPWFEAAAIAEPLGPVARDRSPAARRRPPGPRAPLCCGRVAAQPREALRPPAFWRQLELAGQIQRELLPELLPRYGPASLSLVYRPAGPMCGDFYDVSRLDQRHVALAVGDVTGHGVPAALLAVFLRRALGGDRPGLVRAQALRPAEVLRRLNEEILEANLSECMFAALVYAVLNTRTLRLRIARAGAPYPLLRRCGGRAALLRPSGMLIGVAPDAGFAVDTVQLGPGDELLLYTDGLERIVLPGRVAEGPAAPRPTCPVDEGVTESGWYARLVEQGAQAALESLTARHDLLRRAGCPLDDLTVLALHIER